MSNAFSVLRVFALILLMFGTTMLLPLSASWIFNDGAQSAYDEFGKRYADVLKRYGIAVELLPSQGSSANLELLRTGQADLGFAVAQVGQLPR